jgi:hypothetical protein
MTQRRPATSVALPRHRHGLDTEQASRRSTRPAFARRSPLLVRFRSRADPHTAAKEIDRAVGDCVMPSACLSLLGVQSFPSLCEGSPLLGRLAARPCSTSLTTSTPSSCVEAARPARALPAHVAPRSCAPLVCPGAADAPAACYAPPRTTRANPESRGERVAEELTRGWHTAGMPTGRHLGHRAPNDADKARTARAVARAADLAPIIGELRARGVTTLNGIAAALNERRVPTPAGSGHWHAAQVARLLKRLAG